MASSTAPIMKSVRATVSRRRFTGLGVLLVTAILGADALMIATQRTAAIEAFRTATTNLARGIGAQTARSFADIDTVLRGLDDALTGPPPSGGPPAATAQTVSALMQQQLRFLPAIASLAAIDPAGRVTAHAGPWPPPGLNITSQDFFHHIITENRPGPPALFIGAPVRDRVRGTWSSILARRIDDAHGAVAGLVVAQLSLAALEDFYRLAMPPRRMVTLARTDGVVLARFPAENAIGRDLMSYPPWRGAAAAGGGSYLARGFLAKSRVLAVVHPLPGVPLVIETAVAETEVLAAWHAELPWMVAGGAAASLLTIGLLRLFAGQVRRLAQQNTDLDAARGQLDVAMANITQGLCFYDAAERLIVCNRRYGELYALPAALMRRGTSFRAVIAHRFATNPPTNQSENDYLMARAAIAHAGQLHHAVIELTDGRTIAIQQQPMPGGGWVATHEDITERRRAEDKISFMARHDVLTGLPNRSLLHVRMGEARSRAMRGPGFAILFLDLDRFKAVNDTLGHGAGDALLREVADRLRATVRDTDTVARLGGDEFVVLQSDVTLPEECAVLAERIINTVAAPYSIAGNDVVIGVSIGIDMATSESVARGGASAEEILKQADMALYISKSEGRGTYRFFVPEMDADVQNRHALEADLRCALTRNEFCPC